MKLNRRRLRRLIESVINEDVMDYLSSNASVVTAQTDPYISFFEENGYDFDGSNVEYYDGSRYDKTLSGIKEKAATRTSPGVAAYINCRGTSEAKIIEKELNDKFPKFKDGIYASSFIKAEAQGDKVLIYQDKVYGG